MLRALISGIAEKYIIGKPRYKPGAKHKRGRGTGKQ